MVLDSTKLPLRIRLPAIYLISQGKTGLSSLALRRQLGTNYRTASLTLWAQVVSMANFNYGINCETENGAKRLHLFISKMNIFRDGLDVRTLCVNSIVQGEPDRHGIATTER